MTSRCVKWSKEALEFWESSPDNSVVLDIIVSYACTSQSGEGFEDLVNSINNTPVRNKVKKVVITDTSYMYRYCIHEFSSYSDANTPTMWYLNNRPSIEKLTVDTVIKSWSEGIKSGEFEYFYKKILTDYEGDRNGNGVVREFRDLVFADSAVAAYKNNYKLENCIDFMLEECAYACAFLSGRNLLYPMNLARCMLNAFKRYNIGIIHLDYKTSRYAQKHSRYRESRFDMLDKEIATFMKEKVSNVNFFVIDKFGNHIYKNYALGNVVGDINAKRLTQQSWNVTSEVIKTRKQIIVEEDYKGVSYLSVKAPMIIDGEVEGVIGLAVDITDRKKAEQLELQNKLKENAKILADQVAHDICSPLIVLSMLADNCKNLDEKEHITLRNSITSIENIAQSLLNGCNKANNKSTELTEESYILFPFSLREVLDDKERQCRDFQNVKFDYSYTMTSNFVFIKGDYSNYCRMISNLINNAVEALKDRSGLIAINFIEEDQKNKIIIKDNGNGMSKEMVAKLNRNEQVASTKETGHGIGMQQIRSTLQQMNGQMSIDSTEDVGTEITLTFPKSHYPQWFTDTIVLRKGDTVVVLDDDPSMHSVWENRLEQHLNDVAVRYFTQGSEAIDFINSSKEKEKVFLLTDYELRNQDVNGVDIIEKCGIHRSIVVTSVYVYRIKDFLEKFKFTKFLPKSYISRISIVIKENRKTEDMNIMSATADFVFIDDDESVVNALCVFLEERGLKADAYNSADAFLSNLHKYPKDTKIVADHELKHGGNGFDLLEKLHEQGYSRLYLMSGRSFENQNPPPYITVLLKDAAVIKKLLANT